MRLLFGRDDLPNRLKIHIIFHTLFYSIVLSSDSISLNIYYIYFTLIHMTDGSIFFLHPMDESGFENRHP